MDIRNHSRYNVVSHLILSLKLGSTERSSLKSFQTDPVVWVVSSTPSDQITKETQQGFDYGFRRISPVFRAFSFRKPLCADYFRQIHPRGCLGNPTYRYGAARTLRSHLTDEGLSTINYFQQSRFWYPYEQSQPCPEGFGTLMNSQVYPSYICDSWDQNL